MHIKYIHNRFKLSEKAYHLSYWNIIALQCCISFWLYNIMNYISWMKQFNFSLFNTHTILIYISFRQDGWCHPAVTKRHKGSPLCNVIHWWMEHGNLLTNDYTWAWHSFPLLPPPRWTFLAYPQKPSEFPVQESLLDGQFVPKSTETVIQETYSMCGGILPVWYCKHCFWECLPVGQPRHSRLGAGTVV